MNDELLGQQLGSYELVKKLGQGAFGSVYLGKHFLLEHKPPVAIKVLNNSLTSQEEIDRFFQEAVLLDELTHPYILPVLDANLYEGYPFFVAEYAPGGSLRDRMDQLDGQPMETADIIRIVSQVGQGLQHAHNNNVVHRDMKPANILFNAKDDAVIADFGIAVHTQKTSRADEIGTPMYMSPEQFKGKISKRSDQYALGSITYELFTGQPLFIADDPYTIGYKHIYEQPTEPSTINPDIPEAIEEVILKALAKERDARYPNVIDFVQALQEAAGIDIPQVVEEEPVSNPPVEPGKEEHDDGAPSVIVHHDPLGRRKAADNETVQSESSIVPIRPKRPAPPATLTKATLLWSVETGQDHTYYSEPAFYNGVVYAGTYTTAETTKGGRPSQLRALDGNDGKVLWSFNAAHSIYDAPSISNGIVYFTTGDINKAGQVYAVDAKSGKGLWSADTIEYMRAKPIVIQNTVYAYSEHAVYALDARSGEEQWCVTLKSSLAGRPAIASGMVFLGTEMGHCYAVDATSGSRQAKFTDTGELLAAITVNGSPWCICFSEDLLYALDTRTGDVRWTQDIGEHISGNMIVRNGIAYIGSNSGIQGDTSHTQLHAIDITNGQRLWSADIVHEVESSPVVTDKYTFVSTFGRELFVIHTPTGKILFPIKVGHGRINRPSPGNRVLFISTGDMHAVQLQ